MNTIEEDHSSDRHRLHALVEVWLNGAQLTGTRQQDLNEALQSQRVVSAMAGIGMLRNIASYLHGEITSTGVGVIWGPRDMGPLQAYIPSDMGLLGAAHVTSDLRPPSP